MANCRRRDISDSLKKMDITLAKYSLLFCQNCQYTEWLSQPQDRDTEAACDLNIIWQGREFKTVFRTGRVDDQSFIRRQSVIGKIVGRDFQSNFSDRTILPTFTGLEH